MAVVVAVETAAVGVPLAAGVAAGAPAAGVAALVVPADYAFALGPAAAAHAAAAVAAYVDRQPFAGPHAAVPGPVAARRAGAPGPAASAYSAALVDVAAQAADCRWAADLTAAPMEADRCVRSEVDYSVVDYSPADWAARWAAA